MNWAAREGILSIFAIFAVNAASFIFLDKSLPLGVEAIGGIVTITTAAFGISTARGYLADRMYFSASVETQQITSYTPGGTAPSTIPPGG